MRVSLRWNHLEVLAQTRYARDPGVLWNLWFSGRIDRLVILTSPTCPSFFWLGIMSFSSKPH